MSEDEYSYSCVVYNKGDQEDSENMDPAMQPTPEMIQEFLENINEDGENGDQKARNNKSANQYFYRHHYLSIIQEEEEKSDIDTPCSSRASSRPGSIYGYKSLNAFNAAAAARGSKESTPDSPKRSPKRKTDSIGSELSVDSVNSILSDEGSCKTYSSLSTARRSRDFDDFQINREESSAKKLLLENVPPPPKSQPPRIDELTSALEKQLSEIEKHVLEKRKQTAAAAARAASYSANTSEQQQLSAQTKTHQPIEAAGAHGPGQKLVNLTSSANANSSASKEENSTKFGNSMREMLKNVVSSQKNVLYKKVDTIEQQQQNIRDQGAAQAPPQAQQKTKMGKFFQTLSLKNSLSKSSQSVEKSKSKDSLVSNTDSDVSKFVTPKLQQPPVLPDKKLDKKQRSKSLSSENRHRSNSSNRSEVGSSSANTAAGKQSTSGAGGRAEGQVKPQTRWLGKNPFDTSPATEAYPKMTQQQQAAWLGRGRMAHNDALKKKVQHWESQKSE